MQPTIRYELEYFERLLSPVDREMTGPLSSSFDNLDQEVTRIKQTFVNEVFTFQDERHLERYIQYHQQALIMLMDETLKIINDDKDDLHKLYQSAYNCLDDLLTYIERHFSKYFDQDAKTPTAYVTIIKNDMRSSIADIDSKLQELNADQKLCDALLYALGKLANSDPTKEVSYRKVLYTKEVQKELVRLLARVNNESDVDEDLRNVLYYLNYNSIKSFTYHTNQIDLLLSETDSRHDMIERLSFILKKINQAQVKPGIAYNNQAPSLKSQLTSYIIEEIEHLQRLQQLRQSHLSKTGEVLSEFRIQIEMSVAQIAYLAKLLVESRVIGNRNVAALLRFFSKILVSKKVETISYDSLRSKYYNVEQGTRDAVRNILMRLAGAIDRIT